jgi:hypothetical protein
MIELFSSWLLVKGNDYCHFRIRFVSEITFTAILLDKEHRGHPSHFENRILVHRAFLR